MSKNYSINFNLSIVFITLLFIMLKLKNLISWSWIWVLSPLWLMPFAIFFFICGIILFPFIWAMIIHFINKVFNK